MSTSDRPDAWVSAPPTLSTPHRVTVTVLARLLDRWRATPAASVRTSGRPLTQ